MQVELSKCCCSPTLHLGRPSRRQRRTDASWKLNYTVCLSHKTSKIISFFFLTWKISQLANTWFMVRISKKYSVVITALLCSITAIFGHRTQSQNYCVLRIGGLETDQSSRLSSSHTYSNRTALLVRQRHIWPRHNWTHSVRSRTHPSRDPATEPNPTRLYFSKMPPQAGRRCILSTGSLIALSSNAHLRRDGSSGSRTDPACGSLLRAPGARSPQPAPSRRLTERFALPCCYGRQHWVALLDNVRVPVAVGNILSPPPPPVFDCWRFGCARFPRMLQQAQQQRSLPSDIAFPTTPHSENAPAPRRN